MHIFNICLSDLKKKIVDLRTVKRQCRQQRYHIDVLAKKKVQLTALII